MTNDNLKNITGELLGLSCHLRDDVDEGWSAVILGMIGACYCLFKAKEFSNADRGHRLQRSEGVNLLEQIRVAGSINEQEFRCWFAGYYLNGAELRIQSSLERLLKIFCKIEYKKKVSIYDLLSLFDRKCPHCKLDYYECTPDISRLLSDIKEAFSKERLRKSEIKSPAACLVRVWRRVNEIKHSGKLPSVDVDSPLRRWQDSVCAISALIQIYKDFARHSKLLKKIEPIVSSTVPI